MPIQEFDKETLQEQKVYIDDPDYPGNTLRLVYMNKDKLGLFIGLADTETVPVGNELVDVDSRGKKLFAL